MSAFVTNQIYNLPRLPPLGEMKEEDWRIGLRRTIGKVKKEDWGALATMMGMATRTSSQNINSQYCNLFTTIPSFLI